MTEINLNRIIFFHFQDHFAFDVFGKGQMMNTAALHQFLAS